MTALIQLFTKPQSQAQQQKPKLVCNYKDNYYGDMVCVIKNGAKANK